MMIWMIKKPLEIIEDNEEEYIQNIKNVAKNFFDKLQGWLEFKNYG